MQVKIGLIFLVLVSNLCVAEEKPWAIDISDCLNRDCWAQAEHVFSPAPGIRVQAWFDIVHWEDRQKISFYPLFNIYNTTGTPKEITFGMKLLDKDFNILAEAYNTKMFNNVSENIAEPTDDTFYSIGAIRLTEKIILNTKYLKVIFKD